MKRVLITGGAGFIGSHLAQVLLDQGDEVRIIDNLSTGSLRNISHLNEVTFIEGDVRDRIRLRQAAIGCEVIYHLAASVGVKHIMGHLVESIENNIDGTTAVLEAAAETGARVLIASTSEVYGKNAEQPSRESDDLRMGDTRKSRWSYACSKALDEYLGFAYSAERGVPVTVIRLFNTVGEGQTSQYGMVLPTFVGQALRGEALTIYGDGRQTRCFCHVADVVNVLPRLMDHAQSIGEVFNIGSTEEISIGELASLVIEIVGTGSEKVLIPYDEAYIAGFDDIYRRVPNIDKVRRLVGFEPRVSLREIIERVTAQSRASVLEPIS